MKLLVNFHKQKHQLIQKEVNNTLPADQRSKARSIVALIASHADGEFGHRDTGLDEIEGYTPQQLDMKRIRPQYQGS